VPIFQQLLNELGKLPPDQQVGYINRFRSEQVKGEFRGHVTYFLIVNAGTARDPFRPTEAGFYSRAFDTGSARHRVEALNVTARMRLGHG